MKSVTQAAQIIILLSLIAAAGLMMSGVFTMPQDPETRTTVTAIGAILVAILDPKGLKKERTNEVAGNTGDTPPVV